MPQLKIIEKSGSRVWCTLNLSTWEWMVSFVPRPLYSRQEAQV